ncbi:HMA2 domain-containing protein [Desulfuromonas sp. CSMB_57]|uniref:HMA2 domain-containing protein n=1 Tax=Desulfuromonas sp. CSMB_57 TaxID=2807629 RepID=UPI001CD3C667|nr:hypothetical protein [Desulfuromonas sp. CSMB_57]
MTIPEGICVHSTGERLRIRFPEQRGNQAFFAALRDKLADCHSISQVTVNPGTASLLVLHNGDLSEVAEFVASEKIFCLAPQVGPKASGVRPVTAATRQWFRHVDGQVQSLSNNSLSLPEVAFLTLIGGGLWQIARGNLVAPAWYTCFWYGLNIFLKSQHRSTGAEPGPPSEGPDLAE